MKIEKTIVISQERARRYPPFIQPLSVSLPFLEVQLFDFSLSQHNFPEYNLKYYFNAEMVSVEDSGMMSLLNAVNCICEFM